MAIRVNKKKIMAEMGQSVTDLNAFATNLGKVEAYNPISDIAYGKEQKKLVVTFKDGKSSSFDVAPAKSGTEVDPVDAENTVSVDQLVFAGTTDKMTFKQMASVTNKTGAGPNPAPYASEVPLFAKGPTGASGTSYSETKAAKKTETTSVTSTKYTADGKRKVYDFGVAPLASLSPTGLSASASVANIGIKAFSFSASVSNTSFDIVFIHGVGNTYKAAGHVSEFNGVGAKLCGIAVGVIPLLGLFSLFAAGTSANQNQGNGLQNDDRAQIH